MGSSLRLVYAFSPFLLALLPANAQSQTARTDTLLYVGTYSERGSEGIYVFSWDGSTGELLPVQSQAGLESPSFLALHPEGHTLYSVNRQGIPSLPAWSSVSAFGIDAESGQLRHLNDQTAYGQGACYVAVDASGQSLLVGNYGSGDLAHYRLEADGRIGNMLDTAQHEGAGPVEGRQEGPHVHATVLSPDNKFVYVPDLGADRVEVYRLRPGKPLRHTHSVEVYGGTGPRHLAFHPSGRFAFLAGELNSTVVAFERKKNGDLKSIGQWSTLPAGYAGSSYNADIHVHPNGKFVYVSNRGHNSIAWFIVDESTGGLKMAGHVSTEGDWPRNFSLTPDGRFLLVANRRTDDIAVFSVDPESGEPAYTGQKISVPSPVCLVFRTPGN